MTNQLDQNVMQQMEEYRAAAIPQFTTGVFCIASIALPLSLARAYSTGWQFIYGIEILCYLLVVVLFF